MQHSLLIFLVLIALGWSPTRMETLEFWGGQQHRGPSKELRIGGIFTEDQYQLDTIQVSSNFVFVDHHFNFNFWCTKTEILC